MTVPSLPGLWSGVVYRRLVPHPNEHPAARSRVHA
jgi:hypothetical protein